MKRVLPVVVLLLVAGGIGLFLWKRGGSGGDKAGAAAVDAGAGAPAQKPKPPEPPVGSSPPPQQAQVRTDDDPPGTLRLEGQVVDAEERPVGGALVAISANPPREVKSEADGSFVFEGLLERAYTVEARQGDEHAGPTTVRVTGKTEPVILRLRAGKSIEVTVLDKATRKPVAGADVEARELSTVRATTGGDGVARLKGLGGGWSTVAVSARGYAPWRDVVALPTQPGGVAKQQVLLERGVKVAGRVVGPDGKPVAGARVLPRSVSSFWDLGDVRRDAVDSDARGRFELPAVAAGTWRFEALHADFAPGLSEPVTLALDRSPPEVVITLQEAGVLGGEVRDAAGQPAPYASVRVALATVGFEQGTRVASCDEHGRFVIKSLPRRPHDLIASGEAGASAVQRVDLSQTAKRDDLVLVLDQGGSIAGTVVTSSGEPLPEAQVFALPELSGSAGEEEMAKWRLLGSASDVTDQGGAFKLTGLPAGNYRLRAMRSAGNQWDPSIYQREGVVAATGQSGVKLVLEEDATIVGQVRFADGSAPELFSVSTAQWGEGTPFAGTDGKFRLEGVAPGPRYLTVSGPGFSRKTTDAYEVKAGQETDVGTITVEKGRSVRGRVVDASGTPVAGAKVLAGQRLFGDGKSLAAAGVMGGLVKEAESGSDGRFEIFGIGAKATLVVAEAEQAGRSVVTPIPAGNQDVDLTLTLVAPGSLEGLVQSNGKSVAGAVIIAQSKAAFRGQFVVTAGADGKFRFDALSPDTYTVSAMRAKGMAGGDLATKAVTIESGKTAAVTIELPESKLSLTVKVEGEAGATIDNAILFLAGWAIAPKDLEALENALAAQGDGRFQQAMMLKGGPPVKFENVEPGNYTLCVTPIQGNLADPKVAERIQKEPEKLPVHCFKVAIAASPEAQEKTVTVPVPPAP